MRVASKNMRVASKAGTLLAEQYKKGKISRAEYMRMMKFLGVSTLVALTLLSGEPQAFGHTSDGAEPVEVTWQNWGNWVDWSNWEDY